MFTKKFGPKKTKKLNSPSNNPRIDLSFMNRESQMKEPKANPYKRIGTIMKRARENQQSILSIKCVSRSVSESFDHSESKENVSEILSPKVPESFVDLYNMEKAKNANKSELLNKLSEKTPKISK